MNLYNLNSFVDPVILDRGRDYVLGGHVLAIEDMGESVYRAEVEGSEIYEVYLEIDEDGNVKSSDCDCPYDFGPICKHQAAVMLKLREQWETPSSANPNKSLKQLLEEETKESLIDLLLSLASDSDVIEQRVMLYVSKGGGTIELVECRKLIRSYIAMYANNHGFVDWRNVYKAAQGAQMVSNKARKAANDSAWVQAVEINLCILKEMVDLLQQTDDSGGAVGIIIEESLLRIEEIILHNDRISQQDKKTIFELMLNESKQPRYDGWSDWQLELLEMASRLALTAELRRKWNKHASEMVTGQQGNDWSGNYFAERVAVIRFHMIQQYENEDNARDFLSNHLHFSDFREMAIRDAFHNRRFDEAIRLAEEGELQDRAKGFPGLVKKWKVHRYEAYSCTGQLELQRKLGAELVLDGDFSYYTATKDIYSAEEWRPIYQDILHKLENDTWPKEIYTRILVEEQEYSRLLAYVKKQPSRIEQFYSHLFPHFPIEVKELFKVHIEAEADRASSRKQYENVCRIIRLLKGAGGKESALQIVRLLLSKYPRKPAFREELMKLNY